VRDGREGYERTGFKGERASGRAKGIVPLYISLISSDVPWRFFHPRDIIEGEKHICSFYKLSCFLGYLFSKHLSSYIPPAH
jgi:hypothetical protein